ncbi:hypothetical protein, variant 2 [Phytophthora nicotianae INRA-310]|uniref:Uncharacterized protein n=6 Tax=Phytophthora nicotianae TaxID=4792 RepID=W2RG09_PHYN3|nr:hypothetical protein, variant 2 [Phytophthora nicotianae INRA-310]ETN23614.1 hypothetical protein, variant 2 [Phytophthora nicotianae INRA-310]
MLDVFLNIQYADNYKWLQLEMKKKKKNEISFCHRTFVHYNVHHSLISNRLSDTMGSCSEFLASAGLFIFNAVDLVAGIALCVYSLYIGTNHFAPLWLYVPLLAIGSVLVVASLMSGFGLAFRSCSGCMALSSDVLLWISLAELGLAVVIFTQGGTISRFLREHSNELKLR